MTTGAKPKIERLRFSAQNDIILLREVLATNPFQNPFCWVEVTSSIQAQSGKPFTTRAVKEHVLLLIKLWSREDRANLRKSGTEEEYLEKEQLLQQVKELKDEEDRFPSLQKNVTQEKKSFKAGKDMRDQFTSETFRTYGELVMETIPEERNHWEFSNSRLLTVLKPSSCISQSESPSPPEPQPTTVQARFTTQKQSSSASTPQLTSPSQSSPVISLLNPAPSINRKRQGSKRKHALKYLERKAEREMEIKEMEMQLRKEELALEREKFLMEKSEREARLAMDQENNKFFIEQQKTILDMLLKLQK